MTATDKTPSAADQIPEGMSIIERHGALGIKDDVCGVWWPNAEQTTAEGLIEAYFDDDGEWH